MHLRAAHRLALVVFAAAAVAPTIALGRPLAVAVQAPPGPESGTVLPAPLLDVIVTLRAPAPDSASDAVLTAAVRSAQDELLATLDPGDVVVRWRYEMLPLLAVSVTPRGLAVLEAHPGVRAVERDQWLYPLSDRPVRAGSRREEALAEAVPLIGADFVHREYGVTGQGVTVAVLDTGIDNSHPDFAGKILDQYCYSSSRSCAPNNVVESPNAQDEAGHGTGVSGIIASKGAVSSVGVAPGADLVMLRVFPDGGGASNADIIKGLDFVLRKQGPLKIRVVNMSLGGGAGRGTNCDDANTAMKEAFRSLVARSVSIFVATGNDGRPDEVAAPACISNSIAVGATWDGTYVNPSGYCPAQHDVTPLTIACFTNRGRAMDILAPGILIETSALGGGITKPGAGTSYASPMAAGVAALLYQIDPKLRPAEVLKILQDTGDDVKHLENNDIFKLVNARRAVESILPPTTPTRPVVTPSAPPPPPTATPTAVSETSTPTAPATASSTPPGVRSPTPRTPGLRFHVFLPRTLNNTR
jgi:subtilisin family serine protease